MSPMPPAASEPQRLAPGPFAATDGGVRVRLKVTPRARRAGIAGLVSDADGSLRLKVAVAAAAADGQANAAVLALLADEWRFPRSTLAIQAGVADRRKTVRITGDAAALLASLHRWYEGRGLRPAGAR